jgi:hypothetical protein
VRASRSEYWSAGVPLLCAAHCLAAPLLLALAPAFASSELLEVGLMLAAGGVAVRMVMGGVRVHAGSRVWIPIVAGLALWALELTGSIPLVPSEGLTIAGSLCVAGGLIWNGRKRRARLRRCDCPAHR